MLNFALFGVGRIGELHAKNIFENNKSALSCIYDTNLELAKKIAKKYKCEVANTPNEALDEKSIDAVLIASPTDTHLELLIKSAKKSKPVLCEKPLDLDIKKINECEKMLMQFNVPIQIGFNRRFDKSHSDLVRRYQDGEIGKLEMLIITSRDPAPPSFEYLIKSGGIFRDMTIHDFDLSRYIIGKDRITEIYAKSSNLFDQNAKKAKDQDTAMIIMKTNSGVLIHINNSRRAVYGYDQRIELFGSRGMIISDNQTATSVKKYTRSSTEERTPFYNFFIERYYEAYKKQLDSFIDSVNNKNQPLVTFEDGKEALILANAAYESISTGRSVKV